MSLKGECTSCAKSWIVENEYPTRITLCIKCYELGYPARLILSMAVSPLELKGYVDREWEVRRRCR